MNLDFFGPGEYPYKTILKETTAESAAYNLKELGYGTHAIHNNDGTFYGRNKVFANLGFDTFTSLEYMNPIEENPTGWAKDKILINNMPCRIFLMKLCLKYMCVDWVAMKAYFLFYKTCFLKTRAW